MHNECGYKFIGDNSIYKLTFQEINRLQEGYRVAKEEEQRQVNEQTDTVGGSSSGPKQRFGNELRESEKRTLAKFKETHDLK